MSRKSKVPIVLKKDVEAKIDGDVVTVKGPKGQLSLKIENGVKVKIDNGEITIPEDHSKGNFRGLYWALISNMVEGVSQGFKKQLEMIGVGFRAIVQGKQLNLMIGTSHPVLIDIPDGIKVAVEKNTLIDIEGIDKQRVGQFSADIRGKKPPEPYKGKGIRYVGEYVRKKAGKAGKK